MKKIVCISGIMSALLFLMVLTGWMDADEKTRKSLRQGNDMYESGEYTEALSLYEAGLEDGTENKNKKLNFNAAQVAYMLGSYEKAVIWYENAEDCIDKYLNYGNIFYMAGESVSEEDGEDAANQKVQFYAQALQIYMDGIMKYPEDVSLKYNYETVKAKIEELLEEQESEQEGDGESGDESEGEQSESEQGEGEESESQEGDGEDEQQEGEEQYAQGEEDESESNPDQEAVERILAMLESQEEESLKNNQEVSAGKDDTNGW